MKRTSLRLSLVSLLALAACGTPSSGDGGTDVATDISRTDTVSPGVDAGTDVTSTDGSRADGSVDDVLAVDVVRNDVGTDAGRTGTPVVVVLGYGARRVRSVDGRTWTDFAEIDPNGGDDDNLFRGGAFINGEFVGVGGAARGLVMTSTDGRTWSMASRSATSWIGGVAGLGTTLVAAGGNGFRARSTDHGVTWTDQPGYQALHYRSVAGNGSIVVAAGHTYNAMPDVGVIAVTTDGVRWTEVLRNGSTLHSVASGNGVFVAAGTRGRIAVSTDGMRWTDRPALEGTEQYGVVFANGEFFASGGGRVYRSADGMTWTREMGATRDIAGGFLGLYLTLGWPAAIEVSNDARTWMRTFNPGGSGMTTVIVGSVP